MEQFRSRWAGEFSDGEVVVFAPELQVEGDKEWVYLWSFNTRKIERYLRSMARADLRTITDEAKAASIVQEFLQDLSRKKQDLAKEAIELHRRRLEHLGLRYSGVSTAIRRQRRIAHCWQCTVILDNATDVECNSCGWILCTCGACGCGRDK